MAQPRFVTEGELNLGADYKGVARVDPAGDDATGVLEDILKPFLTVQGAINALEAETLKDPARFAFPIIEITFNNSSENITTSLTKLKLRGIDKRQDAFGNLTLTANAEISLFLESLWAGGAVSAAATDHTLIVYAESCQLADVNNSVGNVSVYGNSTTTVNGTISAAADHLIQLYDINSSVSSLVINSPGSFALAFNCLILTVTACAEIDLFDSRIGGSNGATVTTYDDTMLKNPIFPDTDPHIAGAAYWVTGVLTKSTG